MAMLLSDKSTLVHVDVMGNLDVDSRRGLRYWAFLFFVRHPARRVRRVDFSVMECGVVCAATTVTVEVLEN